MPLSKEVKINVWFYSLLAIFAISTFVMVTLEIHGMFCTIPSVSFIGACVAAYLKYENFDKE